MLERLDRGPGRTIAYRRLAGATPGPGIVFLSGYMSTMDGTKAVAVEAYCRGRGLAFVRYDHAGQGESSGEIVDGTIGGWAEDAVAVLDALTDGPQILVGSSMGAWIMLRAALARPDRIAGLVAIAGAPDAFADRLAAGLDDQERDVLAADGFLRRPSRYDSAGYVYGRALLEDAPRQRVLDRPIPLTVPVRLLHGQADADVPWETSLRLAEALEGDDVVVTLIKDGDHRLSRPEDLERLRDALDELRALAPS